MSAHRARGSIARPHSSPGATEGRTLSLARLAHFNAVTVAIPITGLALIGLDSITKPGIGCVLGVLTAVPSLLDYKIDRGRLAMLVVDESREGQARTPIAAWGRFVSRNAKVVLPVVAVFLMCRPGRSTRTERTLSPPSRTA